MNRHPIPESALADTVAMMLDPEISAVIEQGTREAQAGQYIPIETLLDEAS